MMKIRQNGNQVKIQQTKIVIIFLLLIASSYSGKHQAIKIGKSSKNLKLFKSMGKASILAPWNNISELTKEGCSPHCIKCDGGFCKECQMGYYTQKLGGKCLKCKNSCEVCSSKDICTRCASGYKDRNTSKNLNQSKKVSFKSFEEGDKDDQPLDCTLDFLSERFILLVCIVVLSFMILSCFICRCLRTRTPYPQRIKSKRKAGSRKKKRNNNLADSLLSNALDEEVQNPKKLKKKNTFQSRSEIPPKEYIPPSKLKESNFSETTEYKKPQLITRSSIQTGNNSSQKSSRLKPKDKIGLSVSQVHEYENPGSGFKYESHLLGDNKKGESELSSKAEEFKGRSRINQLPDQSAYFSTSGGRGTRFDTKFTDMDNYEDFSKVGGDEDPFADFDKEDNFSNESGTLKKEIDISSEIQKGKSQRRKNSWVEEPAKWESVNENGKAGTSKQGSQRGRGETAFESFDGENSDREDQFAEFEDFKNQKKDDPFAGVEN